MFHDETSITVRSGNGGQGCVSFRREKYIPEGGPDGGDGGDGGAIVFVANGHLNTLTGLVRKRKWRAEHGKQGSSRKCHGRNGADLEIPVPRGTIIRHAETGEVLADLTDDEQRVVLLEGGKGGKGNTYFKSSINQTPRQFGPGETGTELPLRLELKLIADVGFIGFPNAGKSTMLSRLSAAKPKVANYPFTTLRPQLGVLERDDRCIVLADIPGLIEGAAEGVGLGHQFLRHVERCQLLVHLVDGSDGEIDDIIARISVINGELERFSKVLAQREQILVLNKVDVRPDLPQLAEELETRSGQKALVVSGVSGYGLSELVAMLLQHLGADSR